MNRTKPSQRCFMLLAYRSAQAISLNEWHSVKLYRQGRHGSLRIDTLPPVNGTSPGSFTQLTLTLDLFVGGHRNFDEVARNVDITKSFSGCVQKVSCTCTSADEMIAMAGDFISNCNLKIILKCNTNPHSLCVILKIVLVTLNGI